jgi:hypothetical protein
MPATTIGTMTNMNSCRPFIPPLPLALRPWFSGKANQNAAPLA